MNETSNDRTGCCHPFDPMHWDEKKFVWNDKVFVKDHVRSVFHVPLDMRRKVLHNQKLIDRVGAAPDHALVLSDERSPWGADIYIDVTKRVPGTETATLTGTFLTKVFQGSHHHADEWIEAMRAYAAARGHDIEALYFGYTTCPVCAEAQGTDHVVLFAKVAAPARAA